MDPKKNNDEKKFQLNNNNKVLLQDKGKIFISYLSLVKKRNYQITFEIDEKKTVITRNYSDIIDLYNKVLSEHPYIIFPILFKKKENVKKERNENIKYTINTIIKYQDIVVSDYFRSFLANSVLRYIK